jgi:hypothetical protein
VPGGDRVPLSMCEFRGFAESGCLRSLGESARSLASHRVPADQRGVLRAQSLGDASGEGSMSLLSGSLIVAASSLPNWPAA